MYAHELRCVKFHSKDVEQMKLHFVLFTYMGCLQESVFINVNNTGLVTCTFCKYITGSCCSNNFKEI